MRGNNKKEEWLEIKFTIIWIWIGFWKVCNVKGDCLTIVQSDLILDFRYNCINQLVVTALHHCCMKMHGCLIFWTVWCVQNGHGSWHWWSSNYEGDKAKDGAGGMERRWKLWKELLEEANGELEEKIRSLFLLGGIRKE